MRTELADLWSALARQPLPLPVLHSKSWLPNNPPPRLSSSELLAASVARCAWRADITAKLWPRAPAHTHAHTRRVHRRCSPPLCAGARVGLFPARGAATLAPFSSLLSEGTRSPPPAGPNLCTTPPQLGAAKFETIALAAVATAGAFSPPSGPVRAWGALNLRAQ